MSFADIRDQDIPVRLLRNMLTRQRVPNGLLFWGPSGVGKRLTAFELAKAINCTQNAADACDACLSCRKVKSGNHPDLRILSPVKKSRIIDVDMVQSINEFASLSSIESPWRVFILQDADRMGIPAQNHFLKTLEEPPSNSVFVLITEFPGLLLPTIRSRCQRIRFGPLRPETVADLLRRDRDLPEDLAQSLGLIAQGQMSRALDFVDSDKRTIALDLSRRLSEGTDPLALAAEFVSHLTSRRKQIEAALQGAVSSDEMNVLTPEDREALREQQKAQAENLIRRDIMEYLYLLATWYRDELVYSVTNDTERILNRDQEDRLKKVGPQIYEDKIAAIEKARGYLDRFLNEERVFRDLFFVLAR